MTFSVDCQHRQHFGGWGHAPNPVVPASCRDDRHRGPMAVGVTEAVLTVDLVHPHHAAAREPRQGGGGEPAVDEGDDYAVAESTLAEGIGVQRSQVPGDAPELVPACAARQDDQNRGGGNAPTNAPAAAGWKHDLLTRDPDAAEWERRP